MPGSRVRLVSIVPLALAIVGCHTMDFEVQQPAAAATEVSEHKSFFLWGLVPTKEVSVVGKCPNGVQSIEEETTFLDGVAQLFTIGIWAPRSTTYRCLEARP